MDAITFKMILMFVGAYLLGFCHCYLWLTSQNGSVE